MSSARSFVVVAPQLAGRTPGYICWRFIPSEHPRAGGEDRVERAVGAVGRGIPPRWRGGPLAEGQDGQAERNTPALAGMTTAVEEQRRRPSDHPRAGGEDSRAMSTTLPDTGTPCAGGEDAGQPVARRKALGTPPRWRGGQPGRARMDGPDRNTPALAGRTDATNSNLGSTTERPRAGGEDPSRSASTQWRNGTPPRWRGGRHGLLGGSARGRNTPALAGRTPTRTGSRAGTAEHPRAGGEDDVLPVTELPADGTPPRWRGGPKITASCLRIPRNTPALAGRTLRDLRLSSGFAFS